MFTPAEPPRAVAPPVVPRIETERLVLREFRVSDLDEYAAHFADPIAMTHLGGVVDRRAAWRMLAAGSGFWMLTGGGWLGMELRETGRLVGTVGAFFRECSPELELGWTVYRTHWGKGFATEAARAALAFAFDAHAVDHAIAHVDAANVASIRVTEKLGMRYDGEGELYGLKSGRYVAPRSGKGAR